MTPIMTQPSQLSHPKYRPDIDGLRAVAVLAVVAFHAFPMWMKGGYIGVDVFFVISGFLISTIIFENLDKGTFSFAEFYARRIRRIFPALILVLVSGLAFGWVALLADEFKQLSKHMAAGVGFVSNLILWGEAGYFDNAADTKPLLHLWSLGIEEQFYIVWPLLLWVTWKCKLNVFIITIVFALASFLLSVKGVKQDAIAAFFSPQTRFWELLCGGLLAWVMHCKNDTFSGVTSNISNCLSTVFYRRQPIVNGLTLPNIISCLGLMILAGGFLAIDKGFSFSGGWALVPVSGAVCIIAAGPHAWCNRIVLSNKIAVWFGAISYPLYLWHWPLLSFARIMDSVTPSRNVRIMIVALSVLLASLTYQLIEKPLKQNKYQNILPYVLSGIMVLLGVFAFYAYSENLISGGAAKAMAASQQLGWQLPVGSSKQVDLCNKQFPERVKMNPIERDDNFCFLQKMGVPNVLLVGDSLNYSLFPGLTKYEDYNVLMLAASAAAPMYNVRTTEFGDAIRQNNYKLTNHALDYAISNKDIKVVVLATLASVQLVDPKSPFKITDISNPDNTDARSIFTSKLALTVKKLLGAGKQVVFVLPNPGLTYDIKSCLSSYRPFNLSSPSDNLCRQPAKQYLAEGGQLYRVWVADALKDFPQVKLFDAAIPLCDKNYCYGNIAGHILYRDGGHLSIHGSNVIAPQLHDMIIKSLAEP